MGLEVIHPCDPRTSRRSLSIVRIFLASALSLNHAMCSNSETTCLVGLGKLLVCCTSALETNWYHLMRKSLRRHHWNNQRLKYLLIGINIQTDSCNAADTSILWHTVNHSLNKLLYAFYYIIKEHQVFLSTNSPGTLGVIEND